VLDHGSPSDENRAADERFADHAPINAGFEAELEVTGDLGEGVPDMVRVFKKHPVVGVL
jgi:hypothetical protein